MYTNDSYSAEKAYDNLYERNEDVKDNSSECHTCGGEGKEHFSSCCGSDYLEEDGQIICEDCKFPCKIVTEDCETCDGEGEVSE